MTAILKNMLKSKEFINSVIKNDNITCHLFKVLMMKYGYNKKLMSIVKLLISEINMKKTQNSLHIMIMNYINKYGMFYLYYYCYYTINLIIF